MSLDPFALTNLVAVKEHLNIVPSELSQDSVLIRFINTASAKIESYLDRKILQRQFTEFQDGRASDRILLHNYPAQKPTELWIDQTSKFTDPVHLIDPTEYDLEDNFGLFLKGRHFPRGQKNIMATYVAGYTTVPYEIADAAIWTVEYFYQLRSDRRVGMSSKSKNQETTSFSQDLPTIVTDMLEPFRREDFHYTSVGVQNL